jgi:hypothetical protein
MAVKSGRKRKLREAEVDAALKNERVPGGNRKPLETQPSSHPYRSKGATLAKLSQVWPGVKWRSTLG